MKSWYHLNTQLHVFNALIKQTHMSFTKHSPNRYTHVWDFLVFIIVHFYLDSTIPYSLYHNSGYMVHYQFINCPGKLLQILGNNQRYDTRAKQNVNENSCEIGPCSVNAHPLKSHCGNRGSQHPRIIIGLYEFNMKLASIYRKPTSRMCVSHD